MATFDPAISFRGFQPGMAPNLGSSNLSNAIPLAGRFSKVLPATNNMFAPPTVGTAQPPAAESGFSLPPNIKDLSPQAQAAYINATVGNQGLYGLLDYVNSPEKQKQNLDNALAFYKAQGDQQMQYRMQNQKIQMVNDIISNIGQGAKAAFSRYSDPAALATSLGAAGDAYSRASANTAALSQLGSGQPSRTYFTA
jgi:hypothetical protein